MLIIRYVDEDNDDLGFKGGACWFEGGKVAFCGLVGGNEMMVV